MSTSYVDGLVSVMESQLDGAGKNLRSVKATGPEVIRRLAHAYFATFPNVLPGMQDQVITALIERLEDSVAYAQDVLAKGRVMVESLGSPDTLRDASGAIGEKVNSAADALALDVRESALQALDPEKWTSDSAFKYGQAFDGQRDAVEFISKYGGTLSDTLSKLADGIEQYYIELSTAIATAVGAVVGFAVAILSALGVITIPLAVLALIGAIVSTVAAITSIALMIVTIQQDVNNSIGALAAKPAEWPTTPFVS